MNGIFEMAGAICHEFNQPLQIIKGNAELLNLDIPEDSFITQPLHDIINAVNRLGNLTRKLQLMTRYKTKDYIGDTKIIDIESATSEKSII